LRKLIKVRWIWTRYLSFLIYRQLDNPSQYAVWTKEKVGDARSMLLYRGNCGFHSRAFRIPLWLLRTEMDIRCNYHDHWNLLTWVSGSQKSWRFILLHVFIRFFISRADDSRSKLCDRISIKFRRTIIIANEQLHSRYHTNTDSNLLLIHL